MRRRTHGDFLALIQARIDRNALDDLFRAGCCAHFALRAHLRGIGSIAFIRSSNDPMAIKKGHIFVITPGEQAFDFKGYRSLAAIKQEFALTKDAPHFTMTREELLSEVRACALGSELESKVYGIADALISKIAEPDAGPNGLGCHARC